MNDEALAVAIDNTKKIQLLNSEIDSLRHELGKAKIRTETEQELLEVLIAAIKNGQKHSDRRTDAINRFFRITSLGTFITASSIFVYVAWALYNDNFSWQQLLELFVKGFT